MKKITAVLLAAMLCMCMFAGCSDSPSTEEEQSGAVAVEDVEDVGLGLGTVTLANMMGKDATEILAKPTGTTEWSKSILSSDSLRANVAVEFSYTMTETNKFDVRLVFEDGTTQDFTNLDFAGAKSTIYLGVQ